MPEHQDQACDVASLREEIAQLKQAVVSHAVVDQAIGVVIARGRLPPESAWSVLREISQQTNTKLREVAEHIVQWPYCGWLPPEIGRALAGALARRRHPGPPGAGR
ncbi:ANTAR domain-containing protein [Streptomyces sp. Ru71]|uniref:ANTAR domain-containing protein n=1 Tax=Streptomyces sp. Ru71 TaxID=2080746 RepID=UPI000CDD2074|nr:ANTAR domain-containing protein [Streptomyces sp. Ru71]POX52520.1 ANTAR domain-containing protein [Streptomyces sp. Ru71]